MKDKFRRILVVNTFGIGDVLFTTPLIKTLRRHMPDAFIDFMCNRRAQYVLLDNKDIDGILLFEKDEFRKVFRESKIGLARKIWAFIKRIRLKKYDLVVDLSLGYQVSLILRMLGVKRIVGFNYRNRGKFLTDKLDIGGFNGKHVVEYYLDLLKLIGIMDPAKDGLELAVTEKLERWAEETIRYNGLEGKKLVALAPGGGKSWGPDAIYRRWDPENFGRIADELSKRHHDIYFLILGSFDETGLCDVIEKKLGRRAVNLCGKLSLSQSIALIRRCAAVLCNDGGILHIAVSQNVRTVSIFGPVDHRVYGPYPSTPQNKVVVADKVECRPCYNNFKHRICETLQCLKEISRDKVLELMQESLNT